LGPVVAPDGERQARAFRFARVDGGELDAAELRGRLTVVGLAATYDAASQAQARFLQALVRRHRPRINVVLVVLEPPAHLPLAQAFARTLGLTYPVVMADAATIAGSGAFPGLHHVPSVVVLDQDGREAWRELGLVEEPTLVAALRRLEATR
jgi:hypothetical protein